MRRVAVCLLVVLGYGALRADHLPDNLRSKTKREHLLAGIDIFKTSFTNPQELTQQAIDVEVLPVDSCNSDQCGGEVTVRWSDRRCALVIGSMYRSEASRRVVYSVEVRRISSETGKRCSTGRGASIGDSFDKAIAIYGKRYFVSREDPKTVLYQWPDDTTLEFEMGRDNTIQAMQLLNGDE